MGRQAFPIIGGIIGAVVAFVATDGTATAQGYEAGFAVGAALGGIAGSYIDPIVIQGNTVGDNALQAAAEGGARAMMYGRCCVTATCVLARGNRKVVNKKTSNGKGSSGSTASQTVTWTFAIGLGEAITGKLISRVWQDELLVYDVMPDGLISDDDNNLFAQKFRFYDGNESQLPDPDLQVFLDDDTPYFRGTAYLVFPNFDLTQTAERIPTFKFEIIDFVGFMEWLNSDTTQHVVEAQSVTLPGHDGTLIDIDTYVTGSYESRKYAHAIEIMTQDPAARVLQCTDTEVETGWNAGDNIVALKVQPVDGGTPKYYVYNNCVVEPTGSQVLIQFNNQKITITCPANATLTWYMDTVDNNSMLTFPRTQYGRLRVDGASSVVSFTGGTVPYPLNLDGSQPLGGIVSDLCFKSGMDVSKIDVTALTTTVSGVCIQSTVTGQDAVASIVGPYFADPTEVDGKIKWVNRGGDVLRTLTVDDLTEEPDGTNRDSAIDYPAKMSFYYQSPLTGYASTKATSYRYSPQADSSGEGSVTAPVTFEDSDQPAQIAAKLHKIMWTEAAGNFTWTVGDHCIDLIPTDVVGLDLRGIVSRARITAVENDGSSIVLTMMKDRQSNYTSKVTGIPLPTATPPAVTSMSQAQVAVLDIPALLDTDDQLCYYTAVSGTTSIWNGAQLQRSFNAGADWSPISEVPAPGATMGLLTVAMGTTIREYTDTTNVITVQLFNTADELLSQDNTTFLQEQGAVAIQNTDGTTEIIQYRDATDEGGGLWTLNYLQRGRLNTACRSHPIGSMFVLLDTNIQKQAAQFAWYQTSMSHRAVSYGTDADYATVVTESFQGNSQIEWSPASATAQFDGGTFYVSDIIGRSRFGTEVNPVESSNFLGYVVTLSDGTNTYISDLIVGDSAHIALNSTPLTTVTQANLRAFNKITNYGDELSLFIQSAPAGSLTPEAIFNAGGGS